MILFVFKVKYVPDITDRSCEIQHILKVYKEQKIGKMHILKNGFI